MSIIDDIAADQMNMEFTKKRIKANISRIGKSKISHYWSSTGITSSKLGYNVG